MALEEVGDAMRRARSVLERRPDMGLHDDAPATVRWERGTRMVASHANGTQVLTDMPRELGGSGERVTPGWMFRAGFAACAATSIALHAAEQGIELTALDVVASSRSDTRGVLGMHDGSGRRVYAGPSDVRLRVRIAARGIAPERLHALVADCVRCSPIPNAVEHAVPVALSIEAA